jgi:ATP-binding cassette subfamily C protein CydD
MNLDKNLLALLKTTKIPFLLTILFALFATVMIILQADTLSYVLNDVFLTDKKIHQVSSLIIYFTIYSILRAIFSWLEHSQANKTASYIKQELREQLVDKIVRLGPVFTRSEESGEISNTLTAGIDSLDAYFSQYLPQLLISVLVPLTILVFVFPIDLLSGIVFLITAPLIPLFMFLIGNSADKLSKKQWKKMSRMSAFFLDVFQGLLTLKIFGRSKDYLHKISEVSEDFRRSTMKVLRIAFLSAMVLELVAALSTAIIAVEIGLRLLYAKMIFREAIFILILAPEFYQTLRLLGTRFHAGMEGTAAAERIFKLLHLSETNEESAMLRQEKVSSKLIIFRNVTYTYPGAIHRALDRVNIVIEPDKKIAFVGPKGAGKSTLTYLLLKFMVPDSGEILISDIPLNSIEPEFWRAQLSWVSQDPFLFHRTVMDNIKIARPLATDEQVYIAAQKAHIHDYITSLNNGYDTLLGERGIRFSGGEAQRITLARAFLKDAAILILDEPTANLDPEIEQKITEAIDELSRNRMVITIAHKLKTVKKADIIIALSEGKVVETGSHQSLMEKGTIYRKMVEARGV